MGCHICIAVFVVVASFVTISAVYFKTKDKKNNDKSEE